jgi:lycopene beta-cyclase
LTILQVQIDYLRRDNLVPDRRVGERCRKRGLVKPSAGYGVVRIAEESKHLAGLWKQGRPLPPSQRSSLRWRLPDTGFLQLAARDSRRPLALLRNVMQAVPLVQSLRFIDEELPPRQLAAVFRSTLPAVLGKP